MSTPTLTVLLTEVLALLQKNGEPKGTLPTVESVYGKPYSELKPPTGFEFTSDQVEKVSTGMYFTCPGSYSDYLLPMRFIEPKRHRITLEATGKCGAAKVGDWIRSPSTFSFYRITRDTLGNFNIYRAISEVNRPCD